jgi:hypothetical protein
MEAETKRSVIPAQAGIQLLPLVPRLCLGTDTTAEPRSHCRPKQSLGRSRILSLLTGPTGLIQIFTTYEM